MTTAATHDIEPLTEPAFNGGFARMFAPGRLTLGLMFPIEAYGLTSWDMPTMTGQIELAQRAEACDFAALWVRDVPLRDPHFGDVGQIYDPWVWLSYVTAHTRRIALATGSIILPLRHPIHTAKAAASIDQLSGGRLVLGIGSGDRPIEFPAFGLEHKDRGARFRDHLAFLRRALEEEFPVIDSPLGRLQGADVVPKPGGRLAMLVTGGSQQALEWTAAEADGWLMYNQHPAHQRIAVERWRRLTGDAAPGLFKPFAQGLSVDLDDDPEAAPSQIHNGYRLGRNRLIELFEALEFIGVNHCFMNFKFARRPAGEILDELAAEVLPLFPTEDTPDAKSRRGRFTATGQPSAGQQ